MKTKVLLLILLLTLCSCGIEKNSENVVNDEGTIIVNDVLKFSPLRFNEETFIILHKNKSEEGYYYLGKQIDTNGEVLQEYIFENLIMYDAKLVQNIFNPNLVYLIDSAEEGRSEEKVNDIRIDYNDLIFSELDGEKNIVGINKIGSYEILAYTDEENNLSLFDKTQNITYPNLTKYDGNNIADFKNYLAITATDQIILVNQKNGDVHYIDEIKNIKISNPKIITIFDDKLLFLPSDEETSLYSIDENKNVEYFCQAMDDGLDFDYYKSTVLNENLIAFTFFKNLDEDKLSSYVYRVELDTKKYEEVKASRFDFLDDDCILDVLYVDYEKDYMYVREINYKDTEKEEKFKESIFVVNRFTEELIFRFSVEVENDYIFEDDVRFILNVPAILNYQPR